MGNKLYVGNLSWDTDTETLRSIFEEHGEVTDAIVLTDRDTGRSRGFGFVTFADPSQAEAAMRALDGADIDGRNVRVNEAQQRQDRGGGGGGGGRGRGGPRGGGGFGGGGGGRGRY